MEQHGTGASSPFRHPGSPSEGDAEATCAGLVLLFAPQVERLQNAYPLSAPVLTIGRDATNSICIPEQAVSRNHAQIARQGEQWVLSDLGSRNGTIVDGTYVTHAILEDHCEVRIGDAVFKFVETASERFVPYRLDGTVQHDKRLSKQVYQTLLGNAQMDRIAADLERVATTELSCILLGETGTGKEIAAKSLHHASGRPGHFQAINCAAIPENLFESELFGYRRGAFSGADRDKPGLIKLADHGTLFLDEIGDMPLLAQAKLLRVLQAREIFPLGSTSAEHVDVRVVSATHRDLRQAVRDGAFRGDLFARLNEHSVRIPALAERKEDIFLLAQHFVRQHGKPTQHGTPVIGFSFMLALLHYDWPFNVRELESCIKRALALTLDGQLERPHLPDAIREHMHAYADSNVFAKTGLATAQDVECTVAGGTPGTRSSKLAQMLPITELALREQLQKHGGNVAAVGREFNRERMQVHRWLRRFAIDLREYRK